MGMSRAELEKIMESIRTGIENAKTIKELNDFLDKMHPSDCHAAIRDMFTIATNRMITTCKQSSDNDDIVEYQRYQDIKMKAKQSFDHDRTNATMLDVDKAVSHSYGITLRMIRATNDMTDSRFNKVCQAINKIEEHLGLDVTNWSGEDEVNDTTGNDVSGVEENTTGTGDTSTEE
jgi:hypothetical protein